LLRRIALALLLTASIAVLLVAAVELWNYRQWAYLPFHQPALGAGDRARLLQDRMEFLTRRVGDMEVLVLILLGASGLYAIIFVLASYLSATSFARQADRTIEHIQDEIGQSMGNLRELQEQTEQQLREAATPSPKAEIAPGAAAAVRVNQIAARIAPLAHQPLTEQVRTKLIEEEVAFARLDPPASPNSQYAELCLMFGQRYASSDTTRSRFYLERALSFVPGESPVAPEIHYELACHFAASHDFMIAMRELAAAFEQPVKALDARLAADLEENGKLYELASTPPYDKAVNDLLLNVSI
jgi:hypothetical protein